MITQRKIKAGSAPNGTVAGNFIESYLKYCPCCGRTVEMLPTLAAAEFLHVPIHTIYRRAKSSSVHFVTTRHGLMLVCRNSLVRKHKI